MTVERPDERAEPVDAWLRALPDPPLPEALAARVHRSARATFEASGAGGRAGRAAGLATATVVFSAVAIYLAWAVEFLSALARG